MFRFKKSCFVLASGAAAVALTAGSAHSAMLTFNASDEFSGSGGLPTGPGTSAPYVTAVFDDDTGDANTVKLTLTSILPDQGFIAGVYFNVADTGAGSKVAGLSVGTFSGTAPTPTPDTITKDAHQADGDGKYDIKIDYPEMGSSRFDGTEVSMMIFSHAGGLTVSDFDYFSAPAGGSGPFKFAVRIRSIDDTGIDGIDTEGSGWFNDGVTPPETPPLVPVPAAAWMGLPVLAGLGIAKRRAMKG